MIKDILLIDLLNCAFTLFHGKEKDKLWRFVTDLKTIIEQNKFHKVILACDQGSSAYRKALYPEYKQDRKAKRELATEKEKKDLQEFFEVVNKFKEIAPMFGMVPVALPETEADDLIAYFTREAPSDNVRISVLSSDTDLLQLLRLKVRIRSYGPKMKLLNTDVPPQVWVTLKRFEEVYEMTPEQYLDAKSIAGDPGDSIYSPEGVGKETGFKLIRRYGSIEEVERNVDNLDIPRFSEKGRENLKKEFWKVRRNKELISLLHTPEKYLEIFGAEGLAYLESIKDTLEEKPKVDREAISEWLFENGKVNVFNDLEGWIKVLEGGG